MAIDVRKLTGNWIKYLKNNRIAEMQSDPETGKLKYRRKVTADDVSTFLGLNTDFDEETISNAIHMVLAKGAMNDQPSKLQNNPTPKQPGTDLSTWHHTEMRPENPRPQPDSGVSARDTDQSISEPKRIGNSSGPARIQHDPNSVSDVEYREVPGDPKRTKFKRRNVKEAFIDIQGHALSEEDVEQIFNILANPPATSNSKQKEAPNKEEDFNRLKELVRYKMSDSQRKALWRALNEE